MQCGAVWRDWGAVVSLKFDNLNSRMNRRYGRYGRIVVETEPTTIVKFRWKGVDHMCAEWLIRELQLHYEFPWHRYRPCIREHSFFFLFIHSFIYDRTYSVQNKTELCCILLEMFLVTRETDTKMLFLVCDSVGAL